MEKIAFRRGVTAEEIGMNQNKTVGGGGIIGRMLGGAGGRANRGERRLRGEEAT